MSKPEHTPVPWISGSSVTGWRAADGLTQTDGYRGRWSFIGHARGDGSNDMVAMIPAGRAGERSAAAIADADFIVRAVNAHDALTEGLRWALGRLSAACDAGYGGIEEREEIAKIKEALAQAEGA